MSDIEQNKQSSSKGLTIALLVLVVGFGVLIAFLYSEKSELETTIAHQESEIETTNNEVTSLTADLEQKKEEYENLRDDYEALGLEKDEIESKIEEIEQNINKYKNANNYNKAQLRKAKAELTAINEKHAAELANKDLEIQRYKMMADSLASSVDSLLVEQGVASERIQDLASKVELASILKAENISITAINAKGKEDNDGTFKAKSTAKLKSSFTFNDNKVTKHNKKEIVLRLIQPDGSVIFDLATGGGSFTDAEGNTDFFTTKKSIAFDNSKQTIDFIYTVSEEEPLAKGTYTAEFFADGYQIGTSSFLIK